MDAGRTQVPLTLDAHETAFVVFRKHTSIAERAIPAATQTTVLTLDAWQVKFPAGRGAPVDARAAALNSWSDDPDKGIRYFSGTATYATTLTAPPDWFGAANRLWLDLGKVKNIAQISVNGKDTGLVWKAPFRVDVSAALKPGTNRLQVKVTNLWVNRLIGDAQADTPRKYTFTTQAFYKADSPLLPSGLLGPVRLLRERRGLQEAS
jgi:hypothetical protein